MGVTLFGEKSPEYFRPITRAEVMRTVGKMQTHFASHNNILISVSGGSDSDCIVHLVCKYFPEYLPRIHFVNVNTGLEYTATKKHLVDLEEKYKIEIVRIRGESVVNVVKKYGVPFLSKDKSEKASGYIRGQNWCRKYFDGSVKKQTVGGDGRYCFTENQIAAVEYAKEHGIMISKICCDKSKKAPLYKYMKANDVDLNVTGERKAEGGQRSAVHKSCFAPGNHGVDKYMPLWWWSDDVKDDFKLSEGIRYSDCYEVYGMKRTGCVGCPFVWDVGRDLRVMKEYEPQLFKACMNVFGTAYELTDKFHCRKEPILAGLEQVTFTDLMEVQKCD